MLFDPTNPANRFGYFEVGPKFRSYSQFESLEYSRQTGQEIAWNFNDEFFSTIDWTQEPSESLADLYAARARLIRDRYDYLVLYFSGGSDSHNILSTFYENGIYLDEILTFHTLAAEKNKFTPIANMVEITLAAIPEAQKYLEKFPTTKHNLVDISNIIVDHWTQDLKDLKFNFLYYANFYTAAHHSVASMLPSLLPEYQQLVDSGKRVCFIHGNDKPCVHFKAGQWQCEFQSQRIESGGFSIRRQIERSPFHDVFFYWDPEAYKIIVKQCHLIRQHLYRNHFIIRKAMTGGYRHVPMSYKDLYHIEIPGAHWQGSGSNNIPTNLIKQVIYPHWRDDIIDIGKAPPDLYGIKNKWWTKSDLPGVKEHVAGCRHLANFIGADSASPQNKIFVSKPYFF